MLGKVDKQVDDFSRKSARIEKRGKSYPSYAYCGFIQPVSERNWFYFLYSFLEGQRIVKIRV